MAAAYLAEETDEFEGLILLGSYSATDLSKTDLFVLSVYGSEDRVMNREKYEAGKANLPADFSEVILDGGCDNRMDIQNMVDMITMVQVTMISNLKSI